MVFSGTALDKNSNNLQGRGGANGPSKAKNAESKNNKKTWDATSTARKKTKRQKTRLTELCTTYLSPTSSVSDCPDFSAFSLARFKAFALHLHTKKHTKTKQYKNTQKTNVTMIVGVSYCKPTGRVRTADPPSITQPFAAFNNATSNLERGQLIRGYLPPLNLRKPGGYTYNKKSPLL